MRQSGAWIIAQYNIVYESSLPLANSAPKMAARQQSATEPSVRDCVAVLISTKNRRDCLAYCIASLHRCLRLGERGWATVMAAHFVLLHHESASRRKAGEAEALYASERAYFRARWMPVLRRSPGFHPALSLDGLAPALG